MNSLPKTLSKEVANTLKNGDMRLERLSSHPTLFLRFIHQANQDYLFLEKNSLLMVTAYALLAKMAVCSVLPMQDVIKTVSIISHFSKRVIMRKGDFRFYFENLEFASHRLFFLPHCTTLRERWQKNNNDTSLSILEYLPPSCPADSVKTIITEGLHDLYWTFFDVPFEKLSHYDKRLLFYLILFCKAIGYLRAYRELQRVYTTKICDYKMALEDLFLAKKHRLEIIETFSRRYLEVCEVFKIVKNGTELNLLVSFICENVMVSGSIDFALLTKGYLTYPYPIINRQITLLSTQFCNVNNQTSMVISEKSNIDDFNKVKQSVILSPAKRLRDFCAIEHLILGERPYSATSELFASLCLFFEQISTVAFSGMNIVSNDLIDKIAEAKPHLECFVISMHKTPLVLKDIVYIIRRFKCLSKIGFCFTKVSKELFSSILKSDQIEKIELSNCKFELPDDLSLLNRLKQLELINNDQNEPQSISKLFSGAKNVKFLSIVNVKEFSFGDFPYPQNILELSGPFASFYKDREALRKFKNLKTLKLLDFNEYAALLAPFIPKDAIIIMGNLKYLR